MTNQIRAGALGPAARNTMLALALTVGVHPGRLPAQGRYVVESETVRLRLRGDSALQGVVTSIRASEWTLRLPYGENRVIPSNSIVSAEVLTRQRRTGRGALIGGLVGAGVGAVLWLVISDDDNCSDQGIGVCDAVLNPLGDHIAKGYAVLGTVGGIIIGTVIGSLSITDRWVPAEVPGPTSVSSSRLDIGLSLRIQSAGGR